MDIAIVAIGYNRIDSLSRLLASLNAAKYPIDKEIPLIISIDKSKTDTVEQYADSFSWSHGKKIVDKHNQNLGLRKHVLSLSKWFDLYDVLIVLEDDLVVSPTFFSYVEQTTKKYWNDDEIAGISLYSFAVNYQTSEPFVPYSSAYDVYFMNCAMSWGQVWMKHQWQTFQNWYVGHQDFTTTRELPKAICGWPESSWLKYHTRYCIEENKFFVYPYVAYTTNCGEVGTHNKKSSPVYQVPLYMGGEKKLNLPNRGDDAVYYDGFFENLNLSSCLGGTEENCCIDLNGTKDNIEGRTYWLTTKCLDYKIIRSYGLAFRPMEQNVLLNHIGEEIFLYDTRVKEAHHLSKNYNSPILYKYYLPNILFLLRKYGLGNVVNDVMKYIFNKLMK